LFDLGNGAVEQGGGLAKGFEGDGAGGQAEDDGVEGMPSLEVV